MKKTFEITFLLLGLITSVVSIITPNIEEKRFLSTIGLISFGFFAVLNLLKNEED